MKRSIRIFAVPMAAAALLMGGCEVDSEAQDPLLEEDMQEGDPLLEDEPESEG